LRGSGHSEFPHLSEFPPATEPDIFCRMHLDFQSIFAGNSEEEPKKAVFLFFAGIT
jgi:hypothetical protein